MLRLAAASQIYARGKLTLGVQLAFTVLGGFASPLAIARFPHLKVWSVFYALSVALLDAQVFEPYQAAQRRAGAAVQELFDCDLFELPWRPYIAGEPPLLEAVIKEGSRYTQTHRNLSHLRDWYSPSISRLSLPLARLVCQRTNAWWDSTLRKRYCICLKALLWILTIFVFALGIARGMTVDIFVLSVLAPLTPAILWGAREIRKNSSASEHLERMQVYLDRTWKSAIEGNRSADDLYAESILIQNQIFHSRSESPFVFNWLYKALRGEKEKTMHEVASQLAGQALNRTGLVPEV